MVYLNSAGDKFLLVRMVSILDTSSLSFRLAGSQFSVGDSHAPRYLSGLCGEVTDEGCIDVVPSGFLTVIEADR